MGTYVDGCRKNYDYEELIHGIETCALLRGIACRFDVDKLEISANESVLR